MVVGPNKKSYIIANFNYKNSFKKKNLFQIGIMTLGIVPLASCGGGGQGPTGTTAPPPTPDPDPPPDPDPTPDPDPDPQPANLTETIIVGQDGFVIEANEELFSDSLNILVDITYQATFKNFGTLIGTSDDARVVLTAIKGNGEKFENHGTIEIVSTGKGAIGFEGWLNSFWNAGSISVSAEQEGSSAIGISSYGIGEIKNEGDLTVNSEQGTAYGITLPNAFNTIINNGTITVNGWNDSIAIKGGFGTLSLTNTGDITATTLNSDITTIGIKHSTNFDGEFTFNNSGTVHADIAIDTRLEFSASGPIDNARGTVDSITNSGTITGDIYLYRRDDEIINSGVIEGNIFLGAHDDLLDTRNGTIVGRVDGGSGNDELLGSITGDQFFGGQGNDRLTGNEGHDLLAGGNGNDEIDGGPGNDGLYGGGGNDIIIQSGGDRIEGDFGDDKIIIHDLSFNLIDGGMESDSLEIDIQDIDPLDISEFILQGKLKNIDSISLKNNVGIALTGSDISNLTDSGSELFVTGTSENDVFLYGAWAFDANEVIDGITYKIYVSNGLKVYISDNITIFISDEKPVNISVPSTPDAPDTPPDLPPEWESIQTITFDSTIGLNSDFTIEPWETYDGNADILFSIIGAFNDTQFIINYGTIKNSNENEVLAIRAGNDSGLINHGLIDLTATNGSAKVFFSQLFGSVTNYGDIIVRSEGVAGSISPVISTGGVIINEGLLDAQSVMGSIEGIRMTSLGKTLDNSGLITISGLEATGINATPRNHIINSGVIEVITTDAENLSKGIFITAYSTAPVKSLSSVIDNSGTIDADIAISLPDNSNWENLTINNSGTIIGDIILPIGHNTITNTGSITGDVKLSIGDDIYAGENGELTGDLWGFRGNDVLAGGLLNNRIFGGMGEDVLTGGGGNDLLMGGYNADFLDGGEGADALYGGGSRDFIIVGDGDMAYGEDGNDTFSLTDLSISLVDGGADFDTLSIDLATPAVVDFASLNQVGRLENIERIDITASNGLQVTLESLGHYTGEGTEWQFTGEATSNLYLIGGWSFSETVDQDGVSFDRYISGGESILVATVVSVIIQATPLETVSQWSPTTIIDAPPVPTVEEQINANQWQSGGFVGATVFAEEHYSGDQPISLARLLNDSPDFANYGTLDNAGINSATGLPYSGATVFIQDVRFFDNFGSISSTTSTLSSQAVLLDNVQEFINTGIITAISDTNIDVPENSPVVVHGVKIHNGIFVHNKGDINVSNINGTAVGLYNQSLGVIRNDGNITVSGLDSAIGMASHFTWPEAISLGYATENKYINNGNIIATITDPEGLFPDAVSIGLNIGGFSSVVAVENNGLIEADVAINGYVSASGVVSESILEITNTGTIKGDILKQIGTDAGNTGNDSLNNSGTIIGDIAFTFGNDIIINSGTITGLTDLGGDDDIFEWHMGSTHTGNIDGGNGDDILRLIDDGGIILTLPDLISEGSFMNFETIELAGIDGTQLQLTLDQIIDITDMDNQIIIEGDTNDVFISTDQNWIAGEDQTINDQIYHVYTSGEATLLVDVDITQDIS